MIMNNYTLLLKNDGTVWGCGQNSNGQLGTGDTTDSTTLVQMTNATDVKAIVTGYDFTLVLKNDGTVWACGYNSYGQLGTGDTTNKTSLIQIPNATDVKAIVAGYDFTLVLKNDGTVWGCGRNNYGQLGTGDTNDANTLTQMLNSENTTSIVAGRNYTLVLKNDGTVRGCGYNNYGQLGNGTKTNQTTLTQMKDITDVKAIASGGNYTLVLKNDGTVWGCGQNSNGQLGTGTKTNQASLKQMLNSENTTSIVAGNDYTLVLKNDGTVWACGQNSNGQLGTGDTTNKTSLTQMKDITNVKAAIASGGNYTLVLKNDGTVWACGQNSNGQLGMGDTNNVTTLTQMKDITNVKVIASGGKYTLVLKNDGTVWGCGYNSYGQLGTGDTTNKTSLTQIPNSENTTSIGNTIQDITPPIVVYLIYANGKYYTISDDGLTLYETSVDTIEDNGFTDFSLVNNYLSNNTPPFTSYQIVSNVNVQLHTKSYKETYMMIFNDVCTINNIGNIENNIISCNSDKYDIYYTYSLDNGSTWKTVGSVNNIIDFPSFTMPTNTTSTAWDNLKQLVIDNGINYTNKNFTILNALANSVDFKIIIALKMKNYIEENENNSNGISKVQLNTKVFI